MRTHRSMSLQPKLYKGFIWLMEPKQRYKDTPTETRTRSNLPKPQLKGLQQLWRHAPCSGLTRSCALTFGYISVSSAGMLLSLFPVFLLTFLKVERGLQNSSIEKRKNDAETSGTERDVMRVWARGAPQGARTHYAPALLSFQWQLHFLYKACSQVYPRHLKESIQPLTKINSFYSADDKTNILFDDYEPKKKLRNYL